LSEPKLVTWGWAAVPPRSQVELVLGEKRVAAELVSPELAAKAFVRVVDGAELQEVVAEEGARRSMVGAPANLFGLYRVLHC
jgi:hypothetical protein